MAEGRNGRVTTGIEGLDEVLTGGFVPHRTYLIRGAAGTGKTILGLPRLISVINDDLRAIMLFTAIL